MKAAAASTPGRAGIEGGVSAVRIAASSSAECSRLMNLSCGRDDGDDGEEGNRADGQRHAEM